ncbi:MAG: GAF domain-containing protein [Candidatus Eisenbacteria bacterium]
MTGSAPPFNETARLEALRRLRILDTPEEAEFDRITGLAARLLGVPIALLSLIDRDRQWYKSHHGLELREAPRGWGLCSHALDANATTVVPDTSADPRFTNSPMVTGEPHARAYAGAIVRSRDGLPLGVLSVIDVAPRPFGQDQIETLETLAEWAGNAVDRRFSNDELARSERLLDVQDEVLRLLASGVSLEEALTCVVRGMEAMLVGARSSVALYDAERKCLTSWIAPRWTRATSRRCGIWRFAPESAPVARRRPSGVASPSETPRSTRTSRSSATCVAATRSTVRGRARSCGATARCLVSSRPTIGPRMNHSRMSWT